MKKVEKKLEQNILLLSFDSRGNHKFSENDGYRRLKKCFQNQNNFELFERECNTIFNSTLIENNLSIENAIQLFERYAKFAYPLDHILSDGDLVDYAVPKIHEENRIHLYKDFSCFMSSLCNSLSKTDISICLKNKKSFPKVLQQTYFFFLDNHAEAKIMLGEFDDRFESIKSELEKGTIDRSIQFDSTTLKLIEEAKQAIKPQKGIETLQKKYPIFSTWIGNSDELLKLMKLVEIRAKDENHILILGQSGSGKEFVVDAIKIISGIKEIRKFNAAGITESLAESEIFGHVKGAFTGALKEHTGLIERSNNGILFLDEIHHLPKNIQAKLLRVIEAKTYQKLGGCDVKESKVRFIVASNLPYNELQDKVIHDFLSRVDILNSIRVPPIREREYDRMLLAIHYGKEQSPLIRFKPDALALFCQEPFDDKNVRGLKSYILKLSIQLKMENRKNDKVTVRDIRLLYDKGKDNCMLTSAMEVLVAYHLIDKKNLRKTKSQNNKGESNSQRNQGGCPSKFEEYKRFLIDEDGDIAKCAYRAGIQKRSFEHYIWKNPQLKDLIKK